MKKYIPHILIAFVLIAAVILLITGSDNTSRRMDERITFLKKDKIPYGLYVAYNDLKYFFPKATVYDNENEPGYWDSLSTSFGLKTGVPNTSEGIRSGVN